LGSASKRLLITGINGFTGLHLQRRLIEAGYDVYGTVIGEHAAPNHYRCDITQRAEVFALIERLKPHYVIHLAAISFAAEENSALIYNVNVAGTQHLLDALSQTTDIRKVILAGSATVYGNQEKETLDETMCPQPVNHYGISKLAVELLARSYSDKFSIIVTRPFNYTGPGQESHFLIPKIVDHFRRKEPVIELGNLDVYREFNDIGFVCEAYKRLLELPDNTLQIVNLCSGRLIALRDVLSLMEEITGHHIEIRVNPKFVRPNEIIRLKGSTTYLNALVGTIVQCSLIDTLKAMYSHE